MKESITSIKTVNIIMPSHYPAFNPPRTPDSKWSVTPILSGGSRKSFDAGATVNYRVNDSCAAHVGGTARGKVGVGFSFRF